MKAAVLERVGKLTVKKVVDPVPGDNEVLIRIKCCGICGTDIKLYQGKCSAKMPVVLGHEFSGKIVEIGREVKLFKEGDRVAGDPNFSCERCIWCKSGKTNFCTNSIDYGVTANGGFAEYIAIPEYKVYHISDKLDYLSASFSEPLSCAVHAVNKAGISQNDSVGIIGGGSQGQMFVQLARLKEAKEIVMVTRSEKKLNLAKKFGATYLVKSDKDSKKRGKSDRFWSLSTCQSSKNCSL